MIKTDFLAQLDRFSLVLNRKVNSNYSGERASIMTGQGLVFKDHKPYAPGDDYRNIDWRVYARSDKLFIRRFEEEKNLTVHILVDYSGSMGFGKLKKCDYAAMIGLGFAYMSMKENEKFVLATFADKLNFFRPKKGLKQISAIFNYLNSQKPQGVTRFEEALKRYKKRVTSRSVIVIISDFLYETNQIQQALLRYNGHDIILIQVLDDIERNMTLEGEFKLTDLETDQSMRTFISGSVKKAYAQKLKNHLDQINEIAGQVGAKFFSVNTSKPIFDTFYEVLIQGKRYHP